MTTNRRDFIKYVIAGSMASGCPIPLTRLSGETAPTIVDSEHNTICMRFAMANIFLRLPQQRVTTL